MIELLAPLADLVEIAHETQFPHQEPMRSSGGGASTIVILIGIVVTLAALGGLIWLKKRTREG